jgi:hypothetical protein
MLGESVISNIVPVNKIPQSCISLTSEKELYKQMPSVKPDVSSPSPSETLQTFEIGGWSKHQQSSITWVIYFVENDTFSELRSLNYDLETVMSIIIDVTVCLGTSMFYHLLCSLTVPGGLFTGIN